MNGGGGKKTESGPGSPYCVRGEPWLDRKETCVRCVCVHAWLQGKVSLTPANKLQIHLAHTRMYAQNTCVHKDELDTA